MKDAICKGKRSLKSYLVRCKCTSEHGNCGSDNGDQGDDHHENVLWVHLVDVSKAPENEHPKPDEVHRREKQADHLFRATKMERLDHSVGGLNARELVL